MTYIVLKAPLNFNQPTSLAWAGEAAYRPAVECYRRQQTVTSLPPTLCVGGPVINIW